MHLRTLEAHPGVAGLVLYDVDPGTRDRVATEFAKTKGIVNTVEELLDRSDVPVVLITLPNNQTPDLIVRAAAAGKHILCEKPCARSAAELQPAVDAIRQNKVKFGAFYIWRANPAVLKMRELVQQGALGRVISGELRMVTSQVARRNPTHWLFQREVSGGGIASWLGCHWLDLLRYVSGQEVTELVALTGNVGGQSIDVEDVASASLRLNNGAIVGFYAGYVLDHGRPGYSGADYDRAFILRGTEGDLALVNDGPIELVILERPELAANGGRTVFRFPPVPSPAYGGQYGLDFVTAFLDAAATGNGDGPSPIDQAQRVLDILDSLYDSASTGRLTSVRPR